MIHGTFPERAPTERPSVERAPIERALTGVRA